MISRTQKIAILAGLSFLALAVLLILSGAPRRSATRPDVSVTHVGYTNDIARGRLAVFIVSNSSPFRIQRRAGYWIQAPTTTLVNSTNIGWQVSRGGRNGRLSPGAAETLLASPPTNQPTWRVKLWISKDESLFRQVIRETEDEVGFLGLGKQRMRVVYEFPSEWITP